MATALCCSFGQAHCRLEHEEGTIFGISDVDFCSGAYGHGETAQLLINSGARLENGFQPCTLLRSIMRRVFGCAGGRPLARNVLGVSGFGAALSREGRPSSPHTALAGAICALHSEFFTSEPLKSGLCCPQAVLLWGLRRACNSGDGRLWARRIVARSFGECSEQARSALSGSEQFGVLGRS